ASTDPMSEIENRAVADFLFDHAEIAVVVELGEQDNLNHPWKAEPSAEKTIARALAATRDRGGNFGSNYGGGTARLHAPAPGAAPPGGQGGPEADPRISSPPSDDAAIYEQFSERYKKLTGGKESPDPPPAQGDLATFAYYGYGRWALTTRPWW